MSETFDRRTVIGVGVAAWVGSKIHVPLPKSSSAYTWPHPEVGRVAPIGHLDLAPGDTFAGGWIESNRVIDPGRIYTAEEWAVVGEDVSAFLRRRNALILGGRS